MRASFEQSRDTEYIATILWSIGRLLGGDDYPMPSYDDFRHPKPVDIRTKEQIVDNLINKLLQGGGENTNDGTVQRGGAVSVG